MKIGVRMRRPWQTALGTLQVLLMLVALVGLGGYGWLKFEETFGQRRLEAQFERQLEAAKTQPRQPTLPIEEAAPQPAEPATARPVANVPAPAKAIVGRLSADRLGLSVIVVEGTDAATLRSAAGQLENGVNPGELGNLAIAAHRDTYFKPLRDVQAGDVFTLETDKDEITYEVEWFAVVEPTNVDSIQPTDDAVITLITCFPFDYIGSAPRRFVVRARQVATASR